MATMQGGQVQGPMISQAEGLVEESRDFNAKVKATRWDYGWSGKVKKWGWSGAGKAFGTGAANAFGFATNPATNKLAFLGGAKPGAALKGLGAGVGFGALGYQLTGGNPIGALGGFLGGTMLMGKGTMPLMGLAMTAASMAMGYAEGGIGGALEQGVKSAVSFGLWEVGMKAAGVAFGSGGGGGPSVLGTVMRIGMWPMIIGAAAGYAAYKGATGLAALGREKRQRQGFVGSTRAFESGVAQTMRARAENEIRRSYMNARTALGNEAQLMHI